MIGVRDPEGVDFDPGAETVTGNPGDTITYSITVENVGNRDGTGVVVLDTLPIAVLDALSVSTDDPANVSYDSVAGELVCQEDQFTTRSGREVLLQIFVEERNKDYCDHAMVSLKKSMQWDEEVFGLEYDLDRYMIVAVDDFNMGAMENKSLNIFNSKYVLARPDTATDQDFLGIEGVIAHEYFHNWTGNRVTGTHRRLRNHLQ